MLLFHTTKKKKIKYENTRLKKKNDLYGGNDKRRLSLFLFLTVNTRNTLSGRQVSQHRKFIRGN